MIFRSYFHFFILLLNNKYPIIILFDGSKHLFEFKFILKDTFSLIEI